ncbi:MAG TPA: phospholipase D-like domain-containing protein [Vicinamibacterales bacterium]|nr:phospholipase D-like domain-containing protein [Vicinamibacterales bacterium]
MQLIIQPEAGIAPVVRAIRKAKTSLSICIFRIDRGEIEQALAAAVQRGVAVSALIAHTNRGGDNALRKLEQRLLEIGATVSRTADDLVRYHAKYMIADDVLHVFGFNFTKLDIDKSRSFAIATKDRKAVAEAVKLFTADNNRQPYSPGRSHLIVSPETSRSSLAAFIKGARKQLCIYDLKVTDPAMVKLLNDRAAAGVQIRIIGSAKGTSEAVRVCKPKKRIHIRAIIRDGRRAFVGSQSLRKEELSARREVGLLVNNPTVARRILQVFEADWGEWAKKIEEKAEAEMAPALT